MVDVRGDVLRPPHGTTPAAVKSNIKSEMRSFKSNENIHTCIPDWKTLKQLKFLRRRIFYEFLRNRISENWLQILKSVQSVKLRPQHASFWTWTKKAIPYTASAVHFATISRTYGLNAQIRNFINMILTRKNIPENVIKSLYWWFKRTGNCEIIGLVVLSTRLNEEMHSRFRTADNSSFRTLTLLLWVDFISDLIATKLVD